jgi:hypothetical protein
LPLVCFSGRFTFFCPGQPQTTIFLPPPPTGGLSTGPSRGQTAEGSSRRRMDRELTCA